ncbi:hypothetical protein HPB51_009513 [Rhipicephalus microplus]|uniref:Uncharacterized protein n=1 Tax=Rhipicephalus microplus TaxID=6941 RepID=A0A9J6EG94_RHIMP|nr:hypothetical protein HPB51_009513 [Rhipicephalus microplus]
MGQPSQAGFPAQKTARTNAPFKGRRKGYTETAQGPHSDKSTWIGALYGSDRGLPEQLCRRKFFAAGPPQIEHYNIVHATRTSGGQAERDHPIENQRMDSPLHCVRGRPRRPAARHRSQTTTRNHSGRPDDKPTNTATRGEDRESQDAGLFEVSNNNFYGGRHSPPALTQRCSLHFCVTSGRRQQPVEPWT